MDEKPIMNNNNIPELMSVLNSPQLPTNDSIYICIRLNQCKANEDYSSFLKSSRYTIEAGRLQVNVNQRREN